MSSICFQVTHKGIVQAAPPDDNKEDGLGNCAVGEEHKENGS